MNIYTTTQNIHRSMKKRNSPHTDEILLIAKRKPLCINSGLSKTTASWVESILLFDARTRTDMYYSHVTQMVDFTLHTDEIPLIAEQISVLMGLTSHSPFSAVNTIIDLGIVHT